MPDDGNEKIEAGRFAVTNKEIDCIDLQDILKTFFIQQTLPY